MHTLFLSVEILPEEACRVYLFKEFQIPLISISQLFDSQFLEIFDADSIYIIHNMNAVLYKKRNSNGLYMIYMEKKPAEHSPLHKKA